MAGELSEWGRPVSELAEQQKEFDEKGCLLVKGFFDEAECTVLKTYLEEIQSRPEEVGDTNRSPWCNVCELRESPKPNLCLGWRPNDVV